MTKIESHRDLTVWQKAMDLAVQTYALTSRFPSAEMYRLTAQVTRSAASVPANIAEGHARGTKRDYANFLAIAKGSLRVWLASNPKAPNSELYPIPCALYPIPYD